MKNGMTPVNVNCPELIPQGNLNNTHPASYSGIQKAYQSSQQSPNMFRSEGTTYPGFKVGYSNPAFGNNWNTFSNVASNKK
jgi:hypothetical protein